jgi:hypothetical protein
LQREFQLWPALGEVTEQRKWKKERSETIKSANPA